MMPGTNNQAFTLIESLLTLVIALIILAGLYRIFIVSHENYIRQDSITEMQQRARATIEFMARELRNAVIVQEADANSITFYTGCDQASVGTSTGENTHNTLNDLNQTWSTNCWQNKKVAITGGTGAQQIRTIISNTENQLRIVNEWDPNKDIPDSTSTYHVLENKKFSKRDDHILRYTKGGSVNQPLADNISSLDVHRDPNNGRRIDIELTARTSGRDRQMNNQYHYYTVKSIIMLRNVSSQ